MDDVTDLSRDVAAVRAIPAIPTILDVICQTTGMGFAAVARVTDDRWIACEVLDNVHFGLEPGSELKIETTLCNEVRRDRREIVIDNVAEDPVFASHHTPVTYGLQSYISVPIILPDGSFFGTLCAIDSKPANLKNSKVLGLFRLFAELIAYHLESDRKLRDQESKVSDYQEMSELREQFIAVLAHDLRNPLAAIDSGVQILARRPTADKTPEIVLLVQASVLRMKVLIDNLLDLARTRIGGGIDLRREPTKPLLPTLQQVIDEIRAAHPESPIEARIALDTIADVDHTRIAQLFSNLLANAVKHGAQAQPITVTAAVADGYLELSVANAGDPIPPDSIENLFQPFYRGHDTGVQGLGLGLYIASQIALAHGGHLDVASDHTETRFTFRMPVAP